MLLQGCVRAGEGRISYHPSNWQKFLLRSEAKSVYNNSRAITYGELSEWPKEHDWKSCIRLKRILGSNPRLSASKFTGALSPRFPTEGWQSG